MREVSTISLPFPAIHALATWFVRSYQMGVKVPHSSEETERSVGR